MACPYFMPTAKFEAIAWPHRARLPLGDGWQGCCTAPGHEDFVPGPDELAAFCNLGYARACPRLPADRAWDAVRFSVARDNASLVTIVYVCERDYRPAAHGTLEYDSALGRWCASHPDPRLQKMAACYLECYLLRRNPPASDCKFTMSKDPELTPRPVKASQSEMAEIVLPNDANPLNALLGGRLMHWIDLAGALAAHRHSRNYVVTASIDHLDFLVPVHVGDLVILQSSVNRVFHTSMEVGVKVSVENYIAATRQHVSSAYLTFVAIDRHGRRLAVPPVIPETEAEKRRFEDAGRRRQIRESERRRREAAK